MKTLRTNCFETNSSSTHAYSLNTLSNEDAKLTQTFIVDDSGKLEFSITECSSVENSLHGKASFLFSAAYYIGDQAAFDHIRSAIESFTKAKVVVKMQKSWRGEEILDITEVYKHEPDDEELVEEFLADTFSYFSREDFCGIETFIREFNIYTKSEKTITAFIFSNFAPFEEHTYYDG
jgi:hypothetical protein